jgi:hypothetical protein
VLICAQRETKIDAIWRQVNEPYSRLFFTAMVRGVEKKLAQLTSSSELKTGYSSELWHLKFSNKFEDTGKLINSGKENMSFFQSKA